jgi:hypothetical protein
LGVDRRRHGRWGVAKDYEERVPFGAPLDAAVPSERVAKKALMPLEDYAKAQWSKSRR